ncbi:diguanylate cyclase [Marinobacter sp. 2_MG-2023]|uniref:diguanylate cyclase n=1 Tax=Marinobacter sp. 2_MG-2023 TaxID=3062679 RepID=UPI0026E1ADAD|nr:diguanylate cyclase [Marinobacter sp. 2_MG-2023]MDO6443334.1 diguanylate cyclase [Marinobacter sp. 2_MG-2023]
MCRHFLKIQIIVFCAFYGLFSVTATAAPQPVTEGWEYRWGDLPFTAEGVPDWSAAQDPGQWHATDFPSNPPGRNGQEQVWFRVTLPAGDWQVPVLYILSADLILQAWLDGEKIYQYGTFDQDGRGKFEGWPWHEIALPEHYENKTLYFRVFSDYTDIGFWGEIGIIDHSELILYILENSLEALLIAGFSLLVALLALVFSLLQGGRKTFFSIALFALASSVMVVAESQASQLIVPSALLWNYLAAGSYYLLPVAMGLMLDEWLSDHRSRRAISLIWRLHLGYVVGALGLALTGVVSLSSTFPVFDVLLLFSLSAMGALTVPRLRSLSVEQQALVLAFGIFGVLLIADMAVAHGVVPWSDVPVSLGLLFFALAVVIISLRHFVATQKALQDLTVTLEQQVAERTKKAETLLQREQARTSILAFENEKRQIFSDVITELQACASVNQAFQLLVEAMPRLSRPLKGMFYRRLNDGSYQRLGSWGYDSKDPNPELLPVVVTLDQLPVPLRLAAGALEDDEAAARSWQGRVCFPVNVEFASHGSRLEGILLFDGDSISNSGYTEYGAARLMSSISLVAERIGVTLSGISLREDLLRFSYEDALTGLKNRRYFDQLIAHETAVALRNNSPLSLLLLDIDHFKRFNDNHGHEAGDAALQVFASILKSRFRGSDIVCRYGGEEFVVVLPASDIIGARERAEELRAAARNETVMFEGNNLGHLTISVGVANWPASTSQPEQLLKLADDMLYRAKTSGRDNVEVSPDS